MILAVSRMAESIPAQLKPSSLAALRSTMLPPSSLALLKLPLKMQALRAFPALLAAFQPAQRMKPAKVSTSW